MKHFFPACAGILLIAAWGCSGAMQGVVREDAKRVPFNYTHGIIGTGDIVAVMPDGERFEGRLTEAGAPGSTDSSSSYAAVDPLIGNADAMLYGNRGSTMKCRFRMADTIIGLAGGGFGICQASDGRVIDIFF